MEVECHTTSLRSLQVGDSNYHPHATLSSPFSGTPGPPGTPGLRTDDSHRLSINTVGTLESTTPSFETLSRIPSSSQTTLSTNSSNGLPTVHKNESPRNKVSANYHFIQAATLATKEDIKNLTSWTKLSHVKLLLDPETVNTAFIQLVMNKDKEKLRLGAVKSLLAEFDPDLEYKDVEHNRTPLIWAILRGHESIMKLLLARNVCLETRDGIFQRSPLGWAAIAGAYKSTELLTSLPGLSLNSRDKDGRTALDHAESKRYMKVKGLLLLHGA